MKGPYGAPRLPLHSIYSILLGTSSIEKEIIPIVSHKSSLDKCDLVLF